MIRRNFASLVEALKEAVASPPAGEVGADIANVSFGGSTGQAMAWADHAFDHWARYYRRTIVVAGGNNTGDCSASAWLSTDNGQPIVAIVNQQNTTAGRRSHQSYSAPFLNGALLGGAADLFAPFVANNLDGDGWKTGLQVQNVDSTGAQVRRRYYYKDGSEAAGGDTGGIDPGESAVYAADSIPPGVQLSASVVSLNGRRIGGICNLSRSSGAGDIGGSYNLPGH
jgi:hypothetical protein